MLFEVTKYYDVSDILLSCLLDDHTFKNSFLDSLFASGRCSLNPICLGGPP